MRVFIVHAHPEPSSFNGALTRAAQDALVGGGHEVRVSDLYAMGFDPVSDRRNFVTTRDARRFDQQAEEVHASLAGGFAPALQAEMDKLAWCEGLILQFPLWWLGMPAILKGWVDRVFAAGRVYGGGRYFSRGALAGRWAMCSVTVGGSAEAYSEIGAYGPLAWTLYPIQHGILEFVGFSVRAPFVVHEPSRRGDDERRALLASYRERVLARPDATTSPPLDVAAYERLVLRRSLRARRFV